MVNASTTPRRALFTTAVAALSVTALAALPAGCGLKGNDPGAPAPGAPAAADANAATSGQPTQPQSSGSASSSGSARASGSASPTGSSVTVAGAGIDPGTLPQTDAKPNSDDPALTARVQAMWDGIVADDPDKAMPFFFPLAAYTQIKDLKDPTGDWNNRLVATYKREIRDLRKTLGASALKATLVGIDIPAANAQWIKPGVEYNKGPYWRVLLAKLRYTIDGKAQSFVVQSLISWRGQWYVVHLTAPPR